MKPFNLEDAKAGKPVCARDGRPARIICFDRKDDRYPLVVLINNCGSESCYNLSKNGKFFGVTKEKSENDLFMAPTTHEGWINLFHGDDGTIRLSNLYTSEEEAINNSNIKKFITTVKIEWEE
jgi:hypothetical protein